MGVVEVVLGMSDTDLAYMAGVVDSDGYIGVHRSTYAMRVRGDATQPVYQARIQVKQTEPQAIELFHDTFAGHLYLQQPNAKRGKQLWTWQLHSASCGPVLRALLPHLRIKVRQAENALILVELCAQRATRGGKPRPTEVSAAMEASFIRAKELNHVGV